MPASDSAAFPHVPAHGEGRLLAFSFPVTWSFLGDYPTAPKGEPKQDWSRTQFVAVAAEPVKPISQPRRFTPPESAIGSDALDSQTDQWEMVIPRMSRPAERSPAAPAAKPSGQLKVSAGPVPAPKNPAPPAQSSAAQSSEVQASATTLRSDAVQPLREAASIRAPEFTLEGSSAPRNSHVPAFIGLSALIVLLIGGTLLFTPATPVSGNADSASVAAGSVLPVGLAGWMTSQPWPRRVSILRGSLNLTDFRMEFEGRIGIKALGWVFRAKDFQNLYAMKLEILKPGLEPVVALKRFAVIDGQDQPLSQILLPTKDRRDTTYRIRVEALGNQFTTWVQDRKIDQWTDDRLRTGGVGLFGEGEERSDITKDIAVFPLVRKQAKQ
jgi:hypothetical protein